MTEENDNLDTGQIRPGSGEVELRPFRPADARAARDRRKPRQVLSGAGAGESTAWPDDLSVDLLEQLNVLSALVTSSSTGSRQHVRALSAEVQALTTAVEKLTVEVRRSRTALSGDDLEALATSIARKLRASFRVVREGKTT